MRAATRLMPSMSSSLIVAALVGAIMPTSHNLIIYTLATAGIASVSALSMMLAGIVPALILTACNLGAAYWVAIKRGYPVRPGGFAGWGAVLSAFLASLPGLLVVVIILAGILSGAFTATESASIAVAWALLITIFVYRSLSWHNFLMACAKACKTTGVVLLLIGISAAFGYFMALYEVPQKTGEPWSEDEDRKLLAAFDAGRGLQELAAAHERTTSAVRARLVKYGRLAG